MGSFNWLSVFGQNWPDDSEGTIVCTGKSLCKDLKEDIWGHIRYYRNLQFGNRRALHKFDKNEENRSTIFYHCEGGSNVSYIPTLEQQLAYLQESFERAKSKIVICSPFVSQEEAYLEDFDIDVLRKTLDRGVKIYFVCLAANRGLQKFEQFLFKVQSNQIFLIKVESFHQKTIVIDDKELSEGSFNWLSAARHEEDEFHNHEATLALQGEMAIKTISHFYTSRIGQLVKTAEKENIPAWCNVDISQTPSPSPSPLPSQCNIL